MYKELSKEEKKDLVNQYKNTKKGKDLYFNFTRLVIEGLLCLVCSVVLVVLVLMFDFSWWFWFYAGLTTFCGVLFLIAQYVLRLKEYNRFYKNGYRKNKLTKKK